MTNFDYNQYAEQLTQQQISSSPADLHGFVCGALASVPVPSDAELLAKLAAYVDKALWPVALVGVWRQLREQVLGDYQGDALALTLLLPEQGAGRIAALGKWCDGFLAGFAEQGILAGKTRALPAVVRESLEDLMAIRQIEVPAETSEADMADLADIEEHCRMVAIAVFTEMALSSKQG